MRTIPNIADILLRLKRKYLEFSYQHFLLGQYPHMREILELSVGYGGMGITSLGKTAQREYNC